MSDNVYMHVPAQELPKFMFLLGETLELMTRNYREVAFCPLADIREFHNAAESVKNQLDKVREAMDEFNIEPLKGKVILRPIR